MSKEKAKLKDSKNKNLKLDTELLFPIYEEIPPYILGNNTEKIEIDVNRWQGQQRREITISDLMEYYEKEASKTDSELRNLAGIYGDWRNIDNLANEVRQYFMRVNPEELKEEAKKRGLKCTFIN